MTENINLGIDLTIPTAGETNWDSTMKTAMQNISGHDHTGGGKGNQLTSSAISASAINEGHVLFNNNQAFNAKTSGGTPGGLFKMNTDNEFEILRTTVISGGADLIFTDNNFFIRTDTLSGADDRQIQIGPSGDPTDVGRSSRLQLAGNQNSNTGLAKLVSGNVANAVAILEGAGTNGAVSIRINGIEVLGFSPNTGDVTNASTMFTVKSWTPTYGAASPMTWSSITTDHALYMRFADLVIFSINATGTTGGTASTELNFTPPVTPRANVKFGSGCDVVENGGQQSGAWFRFTSSENLFRVIKRDASNWALSPNTGFRITGIYFAD